MALQDYLLENRLNDKSRNTSRHWQSKLCTPYFISR